MAPAGDNKFSSVGIFWGEGLGYGAAIVPWDLGIKNVGAKP